MFVCQLFICPSLRLLLPSWTVVPVVYWRSQLITAAESQSITTNDWLENSITVCSRTAELVVGQKECIFILCCIQEQFSAPSVLISVIDSFLQPSVCLACEFTCMQHTYRWLHRFQFIRPGRKPRELWLEIYTNQVNISSYFSFVVFPQWGRDDQDHHFALASYHHCPFHWSLPVA